MVVGRWVLFVGYWFGVLGFGFSVLGFVCCVLCEGALFVVCYVCLFFVAWLLLSVA